MAPKIKDRVPDFKTNVERIKILMDEQRRALVMARDALQDIQETKIHHSHCHGENCAPKCPMYIAARAYARLRWS